MCDVLSFLIILSCYRIVNSDKVIQIQLYEYTVIYTISIVGGAWETILGLKTDDNIYNI